ncbi:MAG: N-acetylmuramoyl-L-alanine amidase, partial [Hespellia sp.]|nr:N-acetylmuramoyl-L-alanine amidase [Hespellia sp.]
MKKCEKKSLRELGLWKKLGIIAAMLFLAVIIVLGQRLSNYIIDQEVSGKNVTKTEKTEQKLVILDPGHGKSDSGKVGVNGALEKDINLKVAKKLKELLEKQKVKILMTRDSDESIGDTKMDDMHARVDLINQSDAALVVSIHQNSYTDASVHGAQVFFYKGSEEGERAALILQEAMKKADTGNTRKAKADSSYYMLRKTEKPLVIVECGFLSNWEEAGLLDTQEYQEKMAEAICAGVMEYLE